VFSCAFGELEQLLLKEGTSAASQKGTSGTKSSQKG
jgi:hypothetical protein